MIHTDKITPQPCLKLVRILLEPEIWYVNTHTHFVSGNTGYNTKILLLLLMSAFLLQKISIFCQK